MAAAETLRALRERGVLLSIDDFGTGYSSLSYLKRFPVDNVKIDRSFVDGLEAPGGVGEQPRVAAIIAMARALDMTTVAEGVETEGQVRRLQPAGLRAGAGVPLLPARPGGGDPGRRAPLGAGAGRRSAGSRPRRASAAS